MSGGLSQGLPNRMTSFVDPQTGLISASWWNFLHSIWQRTGSAQAPASIDTLTAEINALTGVVLADDIAPPIDPDQYALLASMFDTDTPVDPDQIALLAALFDDAPREPENDPALVALLVMD